MLRPVFLMFMIHIYCYLFISKTGCAANTANYIYILRHCMGKFYTYSLKQH